MKLKFTLLCSILSGLLLTGCGTNTTPEIIMPDQPITTQAAEQKPDIQSSAVSSQNQQRQSDNTYTIYLITMDLTDSYWKSIDSGCQRAVKELGNINYKWTGPDAHDDILQSACIEEAIDAGADAVLIAANSANGINDSLKKADEAGCKIIYVDSMASYDYIASLSTDNVAAGRTAGETMKEALLEQGITSGTIGVMGVTLDTVSCVARETGFREAFEGTDFILADTVYMQDDAANIKNAVSSALSQNYVGFFGSNEGTTVAIGEAVKEASSESIVIGFDSTDAVLALVAEGIIYATMQQNPEMMGYNGLSIAVQALDGLYTDTNVQTDTGVTVITKESM